MIMLYGQKLTIRHLTFILPLTTSFFLPSLLYGLKTVSLSKSLSNLLKHRLSPVSFRIFYFINSAENTYLISAYTGLGYYQLTMCWLLSLRGVEHSQGRISRSIFTKIGIGVRTPISKKRVCYESISHHPFPYFAPQNPHFRLRGPEILCKYEVILYLRQMYANRRNFRVFNEIGVEKHEGDVRF